MHNAMLFLLDCEDSRADVLADLAGTFDCCYAEHYCDENNWYHPELALLRDGRLFLSPENGRGDFGLQQLGPEQRWPALMRLALQAVAQDFLLFDADWAEKYPNPDGKQPGDLPNSEIIRAIREVIPARLSAAYTQAAQAREFRGDLCRSALAHSYEVFRDCAAIPFSTQLVVPYENYSCLDLREEPEPAVRSNAAILMMDIHT